MSIQATGLTKVFGGLRVLDAVGLRVEPGEIHALLGANGSGKSTLVKVLTGVYQPDAGSMFIGSRTVSAIASPHQADQFGIAVVHQEAPLIDTMTVAEGVALFRGYPTRGGRVLWHRLHEEVQAMLDRFDVPVDCRQLAGRLSPADRALVALVIALDRVKSGLELLILDEVTASLPENQAALFLDRVTAIAQTGVAVLMVTHRLAELHGRAHRVTVLRNGRVVYADALAATDTHALVEAMMGPREGQAHAHDRALTGGVRRLWAAAGVEPRTRARRPEHPVLEARGLAGRFMRDVTFTLRPGEIVGVAGLIESGAAELPQVLAGASPRRSGTLTVDGRELPYDMSPHQAVDAGLMLLPVDRLRSGGIGSLSITENAVLPAYGRYWHRGARQAKALAQLITELDVRPPRPETLFGRLSGGNQQKVLLGKWLLLRPAVLVLEDPTSGVDPNARATMFRVLREAAGEGVSILFLSTEPEQLADLCSRVLILRDGSVAVELSGPTLTHETISQWCYA